MKRVRTKPRVLLSGSRRGTGVPSISQLPVEDDLALHLRTCQEVLPSPPLETQFPPQDAQDSNGVAAAAAAAPDVERRAAAAPTSPRRPIAGSAPSILSPGTRFRPAASLAVTCPGSTTGSSTTGSISLLPPGGSASSGAETEATILVDEYTERVSRIFARS